MSRWAPQHKLSAHFRLVEFRDWHADLLPPEEAQLGLERLCKRALEPLRRAAGPTSIASGFRTEATNRAVGGAPASRHLYERFPATPAADIVVSRWTPRQVYAWLDHLGVGGLGIYAGHVHVDLREGRARWADLSSE